MTDNHKQSIIKMRHDGLGYKKIAKALELPLGTIQSFCRRENVTNTVVSEFDGKHCRECGKLLIQKEKVKKRKFCSEECRIKWWTEHPCSKSGNTKSSHTVVCACCKKQFAAYGKAQRKYCSHDCYIHARFGGGTR